MTTVSSPSVTEQFRAARDQLVSVQTDYEAARANFEWPRFEHFNFALDWFDHLGTEAESKDREALVICEQDGTSTRRTFAELSTRSSQLANWLTEQGVKRGDRVMVMLNNQVELWESMLACIKAGFVLNPATAMLGTVDLQDRTDRADISWVIANGEDAAKFQDVTGEFTMIQVGDAPDAQSSHPTLRYSDSYSASETYTPTQETAADETLLLYFTSGTTSRPSSWSTPTPRILSAISPPCTGSASSRATST